MTLSGEVLTMNTIAGEKHETIGQRYGKAILEKIELCCKEEELESTLLYSGYFLLIFVLLVSLLLFLGIKMDRSK